MNKRRIDWYAIGDWLAHEGQLYLLYAAVIVTIIGVVFFGWHGSED